MGNKNYEKGRRKEYKIVKAFKQSGCEIAQRTAGSHSPIDVFAINEKEKTIYFVQAKPDDYSDSATRKIYKELGYLNGVWRVKFFVE